MAFDITAMLTPEVFDHPVSQIELIETHISWVILAGDFAYKIKKPVDFGFLDFSTLEKRHTCCKQELRLNRRLAATIYLDVVAITGSPNRPRLSAGGEILEYAVKMMQFPQSAQLDNMLAASELKTEHIDAIAQLIANFHQDIPSADETMDYGDNESVYQPVEENFIQIEQHLDTGPYKEVLAALSRWSSTELKTLTDVFSQRKADGFIRECHGDLHLRNLVWFNTKPMAFDCIEFNPQLRWIDVISDIAFLVMDLQDHKQHQLANRFLNHYLEATGDYAGLSILPFYLCYRALVRAKVSALRLEQKDINHTERQHLLTEFESYLAMATTYTTRSTPKLIIMRGLSASGKSTISQLLLERLAAIRIRSDVERKRLFDTASVDHSLNDVSANKVNLGIYSAQASQRTYERLADLASHIIDDGYSVIVDAAFLKQEQRNNFQTLANRLSVAYIIVEVTAPADILRQRIMERDQDVSDADIVVLEDQLLNWQPLHIDEKVVSIPVNTMETLDIDKLIDRIESVSS